MDFFQIQILKKVRMWSGSVNREVRKFENTENLPRSCCNWMIKVSLKLQKATVADSGPSETHCNRCVHFKNGLVELIRLKACRQRKAHTDCIVPLKNSGLQALQKAKCQVYGKKNGFFHHNRCMLDGQI